MLAGWPTLIHVLEAVVLLAVLQSYWEEYNLQRIVS